MNDNLKVILGVLGGATLVLLLLGVFTGGGMMGGTGQMMGRSVMGGGMFGMLYMLLFWLLVLALFAILIVWTAQQVRG